MLQTDNLIPINMFAINDGTPWSNGQQNSGIIKYILKVDCILQWKYNDNTTIHCSLVVICNENTMTHCNSIVIYNEDTMNMQWKYNDPL